jgi:hypothetical protein
MVADIFFELRRILCVDCTFRKQVGKLGQCAFFRGGFRIGLYKTRHKPLILLGFCRV